MKKTNVLKAFIAIAAVLIGLTFTQCGVSDKDVAEVARRTNALMGCPVKVDPMTLLDSVYARPGKELHFHYTMFDHSIADIDRMIAKNQLENGLRMALLASINKDSEETQQFRKLKIIVVAEYYDKNGELYTTVRIEPKEY